MTMTPRALGAVRVSPIAFGSMRIHERAQDDAAWEALLRAAIERGVTALHSSSEYESYPRFCGLVARLRGLPVQHVVKLADPHFGEAGFDADRFEARLDAYLAQLGAERIDVVQWMWRGDLKDEPGRLAAFERERGAIRAAFGALRAKGKLGAVAPFPYTAAFADRVIGGGGGEAGEGSPLCEGLAVYLNPAERELLPQIQAAARAGMGIVAIRPLAAGQALAGAPAGRGGPPGAPSVPTSGAAACVREVLAEPGVATAVVTFSSRAHLDELLEGAGGARAGAGARAGTA
jgi:aryl-alcohol dehydrogenase-like predicted oxidoreductase